MSTRTPEQVVTEIHKEREELVSAVAEVRRDMTREIDHVRATVKKQLPRVAAATAVVLAAITVLRIRHARRRVPESIERLRVGRYSIVQHL